MEIIHALQIASHAPSLVFTTSLPFLSLIDARQYETSSSLRVKGAFVPTGIPFLSDVDDSETTEENFDFLRHLP
jgi:hypothetical protein